MAENSTAVTTVTAIDPEAGTVAYSLAGGADAARFAIDAGSGALRFLAAPDFETPGDADADNVYQVVVRATDSAGAYSAQSLAITVTDADEAPAAAANSYRADAGTTLVVGRADGLLANDADPANRPLTARLAAGPEHGLLALAADGSFSYTPAAGFSGVDSFSYRAGNGSLDSADATVSIAVAAAAAVDRAPLGMADAAEGDQDMVIAGNVLANDTDPDGDTLTATLVDGPAHGSLTLAADGSFAYRPNAGYAGTDRFDYLADDGRLQSTATTVTLTVMAVAAPPTDGGTGDAATREIPAAAALRLPSTPVPARRLRPTPAMASRHRSMPAAAPRRRSMPAAAPCHRSMPAAVHFRRSMSATALLLRSTPVALSTAPDDAPPPPFLRRRRTAATVQSTMRRRSSAAMRRRRSSSPARRPANWWRAACSTSTMSTLRTFTASRRLPPTRPARRSAR